MNAKPEALTPKTRGRPTSSTDPLPPSMTLECLIRWLPENLSDEAVEGLLEGFYQLEACFCERYVEHIQRLIERNSNQPPEPPDFDAEDFDDDIPF